MPLSAVTTAGGGLRRPDQLDLETLIVSVMASAVLLFVIFLHPFSCLCCTFLQTELEAVKGQSCGKRQAGSVSISPAVGGRRGCCSPITVATVEH